MVVIYTNGHQDTEENIVVGMDFPDKDRSALQVLHKACEVSRRFNYFPGGIALTWMAFYESCITSEQSFINEWNAMTDLETTRSDSPNMFVDGVILEMSLWSNLLFRPTERERTECLIKSKLRNIMMFQDLENITSKEIRNELEQHMSCNLKEYKEFIDNEMLLILGQMDKATLIFDHVYLNNSKCLVHCKMGVSRSASTVIAYAMKEYGWSLEKAYNYIKQKRSIAQPNAGFMRQLAEYEGILDARGLEMEPLDSLNYNYYFRRLSDSALDSEPSTPVRGPPLLGMERVFIEIEDVERDALLEDEGFPMAHLTLPGEGTAAQTCGRLDPMEDMRLRLEFSTLEEEDEEEAKKEEEEMAALAQSPGSLDGRKTGEEAEGSEESQLGLANLNTNNSNRLAAKRSCPAAFDDSASTGNPLKVKPSYQSCKDCMRLPQGRRCDRPAGGRSHRLNPSRHCTVPCTLGDTSAPEANHQKLFSPMNCEETPPDGSSVETEDMEEPQNGGLLDEVTRQSNEAVAVTEANGLKFGAEIASFQ
ncbi:hypothetical protein XENOCAPTIV_026018 [Xenoophorus captivus]|uniref:protein-serine/threonine phosphatase n=1 Tax=Xenoophorus captivus TaxID=1517983 RepID=A0ABV0QFQ5_9TELE